jgi:hypothetical protein
MDVNETEIDRLLKRSMAATPIPNLPAGFEQRVMRKVSRKGLDRYGRNLLTAYGAVSALASAVVMRGQGLEWGMIAGLVAIAATPLAWTLRAPNAKPQESTPK